jgi:hypothetical protein
MGKPKQEREGIIVFLAGESSLFEPTLNYFDSRANPQLV